MGTKKPEAKKGQQPPKPGTEVAQRTAPGVPASNKLGTGKDLILIGDKHDLSHLKDAGRGNENVGTEDLTIPRLEIVQAMSKCLKEGSPEYIAGAKPGDLINSVSRRNYGKEVFVVNCHYAKLWLVWKDYDQGGGFFGAFPNPSEAQARLDEAVAEGEKEKDLEIVDTPQHLCLLVNVAEGTVDEVMLGLAKTKAKVSREWNTMIRMAGGDRFNRVYRISTAQETNKKNQTYWNYVVSQSGAPAKILHERAEKLCMAVSSGQRKVVMDVKGMAGEPAADAEM